MAGLQTDPVLLVVTLWDLPFSQFPIHLSAHSSSPHILTLSHDVTDSVQSLAEVKVDSIHFSPLIHPGSHLIIEGQHESQAWFTFSVSMLTSPHSLVIHVDKDGLQNEMLYCFRDWSENNWLVAPWVLLAFRGTFSVFQSSGTALFSQPSKENCEPPCYGVHQLSQCSWMNYVWALGLVDVKSLGFL